MDVAQSIVNTTTQTSLVDTNPPDVSPERITKLSLLLISTRLIFSTVNGLNKVLESSSPLSNATSSLRSLSATSFMMFTTITMKVTMSVFMTVMMMQFLSESTQEMRAYTQHISQPFSFGSPTTENRRTNLQAIHSASASFASAKSFDFNELNPYWAASQDATSVQNWLFIIDDWLVDWLAGAVRV